MNDYVWEIAASTIRATVACIGHVVLASVYILGLWVIEFVLRLAFPGEELVLVHYIPVRFILEAGDVAVVMLLVYQSVIEFYHAFKKLQHGKNDESKLIAPKHNPGRLEPTLGPAVKSSEIGGSK